MIDVTALGEILIDFTPVGNNAQGIPLFAQNPGGAPANVLAMIARLGGKTAFIGKVGQDGFGSSLQRVLQDLRIQTSGLAFDEEVSTTLAFVHLDARGDRSFTFYRKPGADQMLTKGEVPLELLDNCRVFHFGSVSLTQEPSRSATLFAAEFAKKQGKLISFDPNYRPLLWGSAAEARTWMETSIRYADILKVSEEEMVFLTGTTDWSAGSQRLLSRGPALVLVSLSERGAYYRNHTCSGLVPADPVNTVDTTGAGDAFVGALLWKVRDMMREELCFLPPAPLRELVGFANAAGALTTTGSGAIPAMPDLEQIRAQEERRKEICGQ